MLRLFYYVYLFLFFCSFNLHGAHEEARQLEWSGSAAAGGGSDFEALAARVRIEDVPGVVEYRSQKAALEAELAAMKGVKLKIFTPDVFAAMIPRAIDIISQGIRIWQLLPEAFFSINNIHLEKLLAEVKGKNALISWADLVKLAAEKNTYNKNVIDEFLFEFDWKIDRAELLEQVHHEHKNTLTQSKEFKTVLSQARSERSRLESHAVHRDYQSIYYQLSSDLSKLVNFKFKEDDDDINVISEIFLGRLRDRGMVDRSFNHPESSSLPYIFACHFQRKILAGSFAIKLSDWLAYVALHKALIEEKVAEGKKLRSEWVALGNDSISDLYEGRYKKLEIYGQIELKPEFNHKEESKRLGDLLLAGLTEELERAYEQLSAM